MPVDELDQHVRKLMEERPHRDYLLLRNILSRVVLHSALDVFTQLDNALPETETDAVPVTHLKQNFKYNRDQILERKVALEKEYKNLCDKIAQGLYDKKEKDDGGEERN